MKFRGVRRVNVRMWEKAVADGNVEQMFGMNIKQQGIEVQGDQVSDTGWTPSLSVEGAAYLTVTGCFRTLDSRVASRLGAPSRFLRWPHSRRAPRRNGRRLYCWSLRLRQVAAVGKVQDLLRAVRRGKAGDYLLTHGG